jgi:hypothetical protein
MVRFNWVAALLVSFVVLSSGFFMVYLDDDMVVEHFSLADEQFGRELALKMHTDVMEYLYEGDGLNTFYFTPAERDHMQDVRYIITVVHWLFFLALMILGALLYFDDTRRLLDKDFFRVYTLYAFIGLVLALCLVFVFSSSFDVFHKLFFAGNYTFPVGSSLVTLYTYEYFQVAGLKVLGVWVTSGIASLLIWLRIRSSNH